ncbi:uncharacterized protein LOC116033265 [Ipomoea triloba]|uniref:uncharacterized protein LOC116033265 n=1 Tax=Ipomoea triloba TaxID=35885 RepID=UPI00125E4CB1|nr:uncharacterized protein LOC116033265 [Ipomoea triloba]
MDRLSDPQGNPLRNPPRGNPDRPNGNRQERRAAAAWRRVQTAVSESSAESPAEPKYRRSQMEGFEQRLQNLQDQFEGKVRPSAKNLLTSSPFVDEIMDYRAPADLKILEHATFDANRFLTHYAVNIKPQRNLTHLSGINQDEGEALKTYLARWQKERASRQADTEEAVRQKRQREAAGSSAKRSRPDSRSRAEPERPSRIEVRRGAERVGAPPPRLTAAQPVHEVKDTLPPPPPLKPGDQPEILPPGGVPAKYCRYHRSTTHTTEECFYLRKDIEAMIQKGAPPPPNQWRRHPRSDKTDSRSDRGKQPASEEEETNWKHKPVINMIVGGPEGGDSSGSRKAWARQLYVGTIYGRDDSLKKVCREPILFTDEDLPRSQHPHRDALVITMDVHGTVVRRVLVDTGSSVNILYLEVFERLGLQRNKLKPVKTPLAGFTGDSIESEGSIRLPVEIGTFPNLRSIDMEFVVVNLSCSHNMILG